MLLKGGHSHSMRSTFAIIRLPTIATLRNKNTLPLVLIRIPFTWAWANLHPTRPLSLPNKSFPKPRASLELSPLFWWIYSDTKFHTSSKNHASCFCNVQLSPKYLTLLRQLLLLGLMSSSALHSVICTYCTLFSGCSWELIFELKQSPQASS